MPSSRSWAHTCAGARSRYSGDRSTDNTFCRSASVSLFGGAGRGVGGPSTGGRRRRRIVERFAPNSSHAFFVDVASSSGGSVSAITASTSCRCPRSRRASPKSACAFPVISNASCLVRSSSASRRAFFARSFSSSTSSRERRFFDFRARPSRAPASASLRHSEIWEEYRPSPAQDRSPLLRTLWPLVVLGEDLRLVLRGERASGRLRGRVDVVVSHAPSVGAAVQRCSRHAHGLGVPVSPRRVR